MTCFSVRRCQGLIGGIEDAEGSERGAERVMALMASMASIWWLLFYFGSRTRCLTSFLRGGPELKALSRKEDGAKALN